jgi:hypothetical protein
MRCQFSGEFTVALASLVVALCGFDSVVEMPARPWHDVETKVGLLSRKKKVNVFAEHMRVMFNKKRS